MLDRNPILTGKIEATYGTDPTPVGADAIDTSDLDFNDLYGGETVTRKADNQGMGNQAQINTNPSTKQGFGVDAAGSGTAGTVPNYGFLLRSCGMAETIDLTPASENVQYDPIETGFESCTLYHDINAGTQRQISSGIRGNFALDFTKGQLPMIQFSELLGSYNEPATVTAVVPDYSGWQEARPWNDANTPTVEIDGYAVRAESFKFDKGNTVVRRNVPGHVETYITKFNPKSSVVIEAPTLAEKNFFEKIRSDNGINKVSVVVEHGPVAGHIIRFEAAEVQLLNLKKGESDGITTYSMDLNILRTGFSLVIK